MLEGSALLGNGIDWVLLHHRLDDGSSHFDWLIASDQAGKLISFRVHQDPWLIDKGTFDAVRTPDHRRVYLTFEGELSGHRGHVRRVSMGRVLELQASADCLSISLERDGQRAAWQGRQGTGNHWTFEVLRRADPTL